MGGKIQRIASACSHALMKYFIAILVVVIAVAVAIIIIVSVSRGGDARVQVVPLGEVIAPDGSTKFAVALTNQTALALECIVSPTTIDTASDGTVITNFVAMERVILEPGTGTQITVSSPHKQPWTLTTASRRLLSKAGIYFRGFGARLGLCPFAIDRQVTSVEVGKQP